MSADKKRVEIYDQEKIDISGIGSPAYVEGDNYVVSWPVYENYKSDTILLPDESHEWPSYYLDLILNDINASVDQSFGNFYEEDKITEKEIDDIIKELKNMYYEFL